MKESRNSSRIIHTPAPGSPDSSTTLVRGIGLALVATALCLSAFHTIFSSFSPATLSILLLSITLLIGIVVWKIRDRFTSLMGLFFLTTIVFNLGRPLIWLFLQDDRVYDLSFGISVTSRDFVKSSLLLFWCIGIAGFSGGYFLLFRNRPRPSFELSPRTAAFCRQSFWITLAILAIILPAEMADKVRAFSTGGYTALYANQTQYTFSWLRVADFILPAMFALSALLATRIYGRLIAASVGLYVLTGLIVGQRAAAGQWIVTGLWYVSVIKGRKINAALLISSGIILIILFQLLVAWREGQSASITLLQFLIDQGITFLLPELTQTLTHVPVHTVLASLFPLGAIYSVLHIGTAETQSLGNLLSSQLNMAHFEQGFGLGGSFYMEIYYACGAILAFFAGGCVAAGLLLRKWEEGASKSRLLFFLLCVSVPQIIFLPRGTISAVTSAIIYGTVYMFGLYVLTRWMVAAVMESRRLQLLLYNEKKKDSADPSDSEYLPVK